MVTALGAKRQASSMSYKTTKSRNSPAIRLLDKYFYTSAGDQINSVDRGGLRVDVNASSKLSRTPLGGWQRKMVSIGSVHLPCLLLVAFHYRSVDDGYRSLVVIVIACIKNAWSERGTLNFLGKPQRNLSHSFIIDSAASFCLESGYQSRFI